MSQADIGLIGLAVMGQNLVLNRVSPGYEPDYSLSPKSRPIS